MDKENPKDIQPLTPHKYPLWIILFVLSILGAMMYSFSFLPEYVEAAQKVHSAKTAYSLGNYSDSIMLYADALELVPTSKVAAIGAAEAIFANGDPSDDPTGLSLLNDLSLAESEWARIQKVMPADYEQYFETVESASY